MPIQNETQRILHELIQFSSKELKYNQFLQMSKEKLNIQHLSLETITPSAIVQHMLRNDSKQISNGETTLNNKNSFKEVSWGHFQQKCFSWIVVCYSFYVKRDLHLFNQEDLSFIQNCFSNKPKEFLLYHINVLIKGHYNALKAWRQDQSQLLYEIVKSKSQKTHWSVISYELFVRSKCQYFRKRDKCREHWTNHLDPDLKKGEWTPSQDILLFKSILKIGKRWSQISKNFSGSRTEHMVKNRYNSILRKNKKRLGKSKFVDELILEELKGQLFMKKDKMEEVQKIKIETEEEPQKIVETKQLCATPEQIEVPGFLDWNWGPVNLELPIREMNQGLQQIQFFTFSKVQPEQEDFLCLFE